MKESRYHVMLWMAIACLGFSLFVLTAYTANSLYQIVRMEKRTLKQLAKSIVAELPDSRTFPDGKIPPETYLRILETIHFHDRETTLAITSRDGHVLFRAHDFTAPLRPEYIHPRKERKLFLLRVHSGTGIADLLQDWLFLYRYPFDGRIIFLQSTQHHELVERFLDGLLISIFFAGILVIPAAYAYSSRILRPVDIIQASLKRLRQGDLSARIPLDTFPRDIGELAQQLNDTFDDLERQVMHSRRFSADVAHELRTPITALCGHLEVCLARSRTPEEYREVMGGAVDQAKGIARIVDNLLLLARPNTPGAEQTEPFDLGEVAAMACERLSFLGESRNVRVDCQLEAVTVNGSSCLADRLICNLLKNAIEVSPDGAAVTVSVRPEKGGWTILTVEDEGPGIPEEHRPRIFDRFYQIDESRGGGTGLGLAIVKWIADLHGARITVESRPGGGSRFLVRFPPA